VSGIITVAFFTFTKLTRYNQDGALLLQPGPLHDAEEERLGYHDDLIF
jgi:hypothetical protein